MWDITRYLAATYADKAASPCINCRRTIKPCTSTGMVTSIGVYGGDNVLFLRLGSHGLGSTPHIPCSIYRRLRRGSPWEGLVYHLSHAFISVVCSGFDFMGPGLSFCMLALLIPEMDPASQMRRSADIANGFSLLIRNSYEQDYLGTYVTLS